MPYSLTICNGYTIIEIDGKKFMLDSGSPMSISTDPKVKSVSINDWRFDLPCAPQFKKNLDLATGENISGIIALEIIVLLFGVRCDLLRGEAVFGKPPKESGHVVRLRDRKDFRTQVVVNGREVVGYMDTGAPNTMIADHSLLDPRQYVGKANEPMLTEMIHTEKYDGSAELDGVVREVPLLKLPQRCIYPAFRDIQAYFSVSTFAEQYYAIDPNDQELRFL